MVWMQSTRWFSKLIWCHIYITILSWWVSCVQLPLISYLDWLQWHSNIRSLYSWISWILNFFLLYFYFACNFFMTMVFCWYFTLKIQSGQNNWLLIFSIIISRLLVTWNLRERTLLGKTSQSKQNGLSHNSFCTHFSQIHKLFLFVYIIFLSVCNITCFRFVSQKSQIHIILTC